MFTIHEGAREFIIQREGVQFQSYPFSFNELFQAENPYEWLMRYTSGRNALRIPRDLQKSAWMAPIQSQEVWAAGVTYLRSCNARMEEAEASGGASLYDRVYEAERPELFLKATPDRVRGPSQPVRIRADSASNVPEPELVLAINSRGKVFGYTIGNDLTARSIEGENALYMSQAKVYHGSCAIGPCLVVGDVVTRGTVIRMQVYRDQRIAFQGETTLGQIKRSFDNLAAYLFREQYFPFGVYLMTGTGIVPSGHFSLQHGDYIRIEIDGIGALENVVE